MKPRLKLLGPLVAVADLRSTIPTAKTAAAFYLTPEWRGLMAAIIGTRGRRCEECGRAGGRIYGDHIHEIQDGGALLDPDNIMLRCPPCHGKKTFEERAKRAAS